MTPGSFEKLHLKSRREGRTGREKIRDLTDKLPDSLQRMGDINLSFRLGPSSGDRKAAPVGSLLTGEGQHEA